MEANRLFNRLIWNILGAALHCRTNAEVSFDPRHYIEPHEIMKDVTDKILNMGFGGFHTSEQNEKWSVSPYYDWLDLCRILGTICARYFCAVVFLILAIGVSYLKSRIGEGTVSN